MTAVTGPPAARESGTPAKKAAPQKKAAQKKRRSPQGAAPARKAAPAEGEPTGEGGAGRERGARGCPDDGQEVTGARTGRNAAAAAAGRSSVGSRTAAPPSELAVREDESPWTATELRGGAGRARVRRASGCATEITVAEHDLAGLMRDAGDGAGDDQADAGTATFEREQEISLANNSREMLDQSEHALERIALGTYGICESCGNPVGKLRLQAFPRATLCRSCKQKQERR